MKKLCFLMLALTIPGAVFAGQKVGYLELKKYTDPKSISIILSNPNDGLDDVECLTSTLDLVEHKARIASGLFISSINVTVKNDEDDIPMLFATYEYFSRKKGVVAKQNITCELASDAEPMAVRSDFDGF